MRISLVPARLDGLLAVSVTGDIVTINGVHFDFTQLPEGGELPAVAIESEHFSSDVIRINGELHFALRLPHGANPPPHVAFPAAIQVSADGPVTLPTEVVEVPV